MRAEPNHGLAAKRLNDVSDAKIIPFSDVFVSRSLRTAICKSPITVLLDKHARASHAGVCHYNVERRWGRVAYELPEAGMGFYNSYAQGAKSRFTTLLVQWEWFIVRCY